MTDRAPPEGSKSIPPIAFYGVSGIDVFEVKYFQAGDRYFYECAGTFTAASNHKNFKAFSRFARDDLQACEQARDALINARLQNTALRPGQLTDFPTCVTDPTERMALLVRLAFLRDWIVADAAVTMFEESLSNDALPGYADLSTHLRMLLNFNQLDRARAILDTVGNGMLAQLARSDFSDDRYGNASYTARLVGDILFRSEQFKAAAKAFELSVKTGDNKPKRRRCIEAAIAAADTSDALSHIDAFERKWGLPGDLKQLKHDLQSRMSKISDD